MGSTITAVLYVGAVGLFVVGALCIRHTSPFSRAGGTNYERKKQRKIVGEILLIAATLLLGLAMLSEFISSFQ